MSEELPHSGSSLVCRRVFEPSRLQQHLQSQAYERIVPETRRGVADGATTLPCSGDAPIISPISPLSCGGCCA
jgi:hypothetical protein